MVSVQNLLIVSFCFVLGKETLWHFPYLVVLASRSKFQSYLYKTKKQDKKFQWDSNIFASPKAGRGNRLLYINQGSPSSSSEPIFKIVRACAPEPAKNCSKSWCFLNKKRESVSGV